MTQTLTTQPKRHRREFAFPCSYCGTKLTALPIEAGETRDCHGCGSSNRIPRLASDPALKVRPPQEKEHSCPFYCHDHVAHPQGKCAHSSLSTRMAKVAEEKASREWRTHAVIGGTVGSAIALAVALLLL